MVRRIQNHWTMPSDVAARYRAHDVAHLCVFHQEVPARRAELPWLCPPLRDNARCGIETS